MFFSYDKEKSIHIPEPFKRALTPLMVSDNVEGDIPFSVHYTEWEPGRKGDKHIHEDSLEAMYCISGHAKAMVNNEWVDLVPETMLVANKNETHCIINDGDEILRVLCIFSPPVSAKELEERAMAAVNSAKRE